MRRRLKIAAAVALIVLFASYVGTFSYWWFGSPAKVVPWKGKQVRIVEFHFNSFSWDTYDMWIPAFWFVEHICGYKRAGFAAMYQDSIQYYEKTLH
jgi:hypothetical protein